MAKVVKKGKPEIREEDSKTLIYMVVGFCLGAIIALLCFEYYWVGVGGGAGMLLGIIASTIVDYLKAKNETEQIKEVKKASTKKTSAKKPKKVTK